jgi:hypothetical protein
MRPTKPGCCSRLFVSESSSIRGLLIICFSTFLLLILDACKERRTTSTLDGCSLVSKEEVESLQATPVKEAKSSERADGVFRVSQCFYTASEFNKSVNLALIQNDPNQQNQRSPKDFWKEKFGPYNTNEKERDGKAETKNREEKEEVTAPKRISGLGDDAYWISNRFGGVLYVLKGDAFISIGLGGLDDEDTKLRKSRILAQKALQRL